MRIATPLVLVILDGLGVSLETHGNPAAQAKKPTLNDVERTYPFTTLQASGVAVGLPWGQAGNSEVGHLTIGSGRIIYNHLPRIISSIYDGSFFVNPAFMRVAEHVTKNSSRLHIAGLVSSGSVHSYIDHLYALLDFADRHGAPEILIHVFTDGKDAPPRQALAFLPQLEERLKKQHPKARMASIMGRFFAMDRDEKWDRIQQAYDLMTHGRGEQIDSLIEYLGRSYEQGISDEFIAPALLGNPAGRENIIRENDGLIFFNFREDSMREITHAFTDEVFDQFPRQKIQNLVAATMTEYEEGLRALVAFLPIQIDHPLSRVLSDAGFSHLHIAETEKYAHVTYFFNGGRETPYPGEDRILIPSIATAHFDETPQMRAPEITEKILENIDAYPVIVANFANADMVGHTGNFEACVAAVEAIDEALGKIKAAVLEKNGVLVVTADHGNIERKRDALTGEILTQHSTNPVPFYLIGKQFRLREPRTDENIAKRKSEAGGILTDVAPTILELLGLKKPDEMSGVSLLGMLEKQIKD